MVKICPNCSCINIDEVKKIVGEDNVKKGCIGRCGTPYIALIDYEAFEADSEEEFLEHLRNNN